MLIEAISVSILVNNTYLLLEMPFPTFDAFWQHVRIAYLTNSIPLLSCFYHLFMDDTLAVMLDRAIWMKQVLLETRIVI